MTEQKRELILKALVKFKGVWPDGCTLIQVGRNGEIRQFRGRSGDHYESEQKAAVLCYKDKFEAVLAELVKDAPEGATHYRKQDGAYVMSKADSWSKWLGDRWVCYFGGLSGESVSELIPLPSKVDAAIEQVVEVDGWAPHVGGELKFKYKECETEFKIGSVKFIGDKLIIIDTGFEQCYHIESLDFRPLNTEAEKERDSLIHILCGENGDNIETDKLAECGWGEVADRVIDAGWRPSKN